MAIYLRARPHQLAERSDRLRRACAARVRHRIREVAEVAVGRNRVGDKPGAFEQFTVLRCSLGDLPKAALLATEAASGLPKKPSRARWTLT